MSATSGHGIPHCRSYSAARQRRLQRLARSYGVITASHLAELAHAERWSVPFQVVVRRAVRSGRLQRVAPDLYEAGPSDD